MTTTDLDINNQINVGLSIKERIELASSSERCLMIDNLFAKWVLTDDIIKKNLSKREISLFDYIEVAVKNFNLEISNIQFGLFEKANHMIITELSYLRVYFDNSDLGDLEIDRQEYVVKFNKIFRAGVDANNAIRNALYLKNSLIETDIGDGNQMIVVTRGHDVYYF